MDNKPYSITSKYGTIEFNFPGGKPDPDARNSRGERYGDPTIGRQIETAIAAGDLTLALNLLDRRADLVDRHFYLMYAVGAAYKRRADPATAAFCEQIAMMHLAEFPKLAVALKKDMGSLPIVPTFAKFATLLTERGHYERAIKVCEQAISFGLIDGTKGNYRGRIAAIQKKAAKG